MRQLVIATTALAFLSSTAFAQTSTTPPPSGDSMSKGDMSQGDGMKKTSKKKKSSKKMGGDDATKQ